MSGGVYDSKSPGAACLKEGPFHGGELQNTEEGI
jgi:hypothetical protein